MRTIAGFRHQPGVHCGSTALRDIAHYRGWLLSEAMCFGLGAGLGFSYLEPPFGPTPARNTGPGTQQTQYISAVEGEIALPSRAICGRAPYLERNFFAHLEVPFAWRNRPLDKSELIRWLDQDTVLLALTDLFYLPYYAPSVHFGGHAVVVAGYERGSASDLPELDVLLADTAFPALQTVPFATLQRAMRSPAAPFPIRDQWAPAPLLVAHTPATTAAHAAPAAAILTALPAYARTALCGAAQRALRTQALSYLDPVPPPELGSLGVRQYGLAALRAFALSLPSWTKAPDFAWCCRFAYQMIEKRGTGGAAFRNLYAGFLAEASDIVPQLPPRALTNMRKAASHWTELAAMFRSLSQQTPREPAQEPLRGALQQPLQGADRGPGEQSVAEAAAPALTQATRLLLGIAELEEAAMRLILS